MTYSLYTTALRAFDSHWLAGVHLHLMLCSLPLPYHVMPTLEGTMSHLFSSERQLVF